MEVFVKVTSLRPVLTRIIRVSRRDEVTVKISRKGETKRIQNGPDGGGLRHRDFVRCIRDSAATSVFRRNVCQKQSARQELF